MKVHTAHGPPYDGLDEGGTWQIANPADWSSLADSAKPSFNEPVNDNVIATVAIPSLPDAASGGVDLAATPTLEGTVGAGGATAAQVQAALDDSNLTVTGSGIRVGVLSDSFGDLSGGATADEADGALPPAADIDVIKDLASGGTDEGRAMMQIIHDIAPGADLAFYTAFDSEQDFANGILALAAAGCKVIVDDVSYFDEPFFQNGAVAQAIQTVEAEGVTYVTAAGNNTGNAYQAAWTPISGTYDGVTLTDAESFNGSLVQTVKINTEGTGYDVPLLLEWNQAYGDATSDLEMLVFNSRGRLVGTATNVSSGEPTNPWVGFDFTTSGTYSVAIENLSGPNPGLIKEITEGNGLPATISGANVGSVYGHAMTPGVITAGAVSVADTPAFGVNPAASESFSSSGAGTELLFANNDTALSSPDQLSPVAVSSVDDISTTVSDLSDFYGTSAAAASTAGVAALILAANPNLTPAAVERIMQETALPMANSAVSGAGLVQIDTAVQFAADAVDNLQQLDAVLSNDGYSQTTRNQVEDYLIAQGYFSTASPIVEIGTNPGTVGSPSPANLLILSPATFEVVDDGSGTANPDLSYILDPLTETNLIIRGSGNVGISLTTGAETVSLQDTGNDTVYLGNGQNTVWSGQGSDTIYGGSGDSLFIAPSGGGPNVGPATYWYGGSGNDTFYNGTDTGIYMDAQSGNDTMYGGIGTDTMHAGSGANLLYADIGNNDLYGDSGNSTLWGGAGSDTMNAGSGDSRLIAIGGEFNALYGDSSGSGSSTLIAGGLDTKGDLLVGGVNSDTLYGGAGSDTLEGGSGDTFMAAGTGNTLLEGGSGNDTMDAYSGADTLIGGSGNDQMISGSLSGGGNSLMGGSSNDTMWGGAGNDTMTAGSSGSDLLVSGSGSDSMAGSSSGHTAFEIAYHIGNDTIDAGGSGNIVFIDSRDLNDANTDVTDVPGSGDATITFADTGQTLQIDGVQTIVFNDADFKPH